MGFENLLSSSLEGGTSGSPSELTDVCGIEEAGAGEGAAAIEARASERIRIAQELHDTLLQGFIAVSMQLNTTVDCLPDECPVKPKFREVMRTLDRVLEEGRYAVQGLRSSNGKISSLGQAFAEVPKDLGLPGAQEFRVVVVGKERELKAGLSDEIYRIGREAIVNACRHARAGRIETEVEYRPAELRVAVRDDGCGIDHQQLQWERKGHWGLRGMQERAERIGARIRISSSLTLGTQVELCIPGSVAFQQTEVTRGLLHRIRSFAQK